MLPGRKLATLELDKLLSPAPLAQWQSSGLLILSLALEGFPLQLEYYLSYKANALTQATGLFEAPRRPHL